MTNTNSVIENGKTTDLNAIVKEDDGWILLTGKTFMYKNDLKERFDARWDNDEKGWLIDIINMQHDEDNCTTPQSICDWIQKQIDERTQKQIEHKQELNLKRKLEREERDQEKKQKVELLKTILPCEKKNCYTNAKLYESHQLDRTHVMSGFFSQCTKCHHYLYGIDKRNEQKCKEYYTKPIISCWNCNVMF